MIIESNDKLVELIGEDLLWDIVVNYAETHLELLKEEMRKNAYINCDDIDMITFAEVRESDEFRVNGINANDGILSVEYEMPAGIHAKNDDGSICFNVTTWLSGVIEIPDVDSFDWASINLGKLNRSQILSYNYLVKGINLSYEDTQVDDLTD